MSRQQATVIGFSAIAMWSLLAVLTVGTSPVPPLQLNAICFAIGGIIGLIWVARTDGFSILRHIHWTVYAFGAIFLFGYHLAYFSALRLAPAAEASLIAYLWPLLIVVFSGLLPGEKLRLFHVLGALFAFAGAALIVLRGGLSGNASALPGYGLAFFAALIWSSYSLISRRMQNIPTAAVAIYCLATAAMAAVAHLMIEDTIWPSTGAGWGAVIALGLGPVGLAFFTWDIGVKRGDIQMLGTASYAAPLLSTLALIVAGIASPSPVILLAAGMIAAGAFLAAMASRSNG